MEVSEVSTFTQENHARGPIFVIDVVVAGSSVRVPERLLSVLAGVPDPRKARGVRFAPASILAVATAAVAAGCRSFVAIGEWSADAPRDVLRQLGVVGPAPSEKTIRVQLSKTDDGALSAAIGRWLRPRADRRRAGKSRTVIAVDGKTTRGARLTSNADLAAPHLLAAFDHHTGVVLGQRQIDGKGSEIGEFPRLLDTIDIAGCVITADALHTQRAHVEYLTSRGADWVLTVKGNQPTLLNAIKQLPWDDVDVGGQSWDKGHGRLEWPSVKVVTVTPGLPFPGRPQAVQVIRRNRRLGAKKWHVEVVYAITSLTAERATPAELGAILRQHWSIENELHWVRDVTLGEDASHARTGRAPAVMAAIRNLVISLANLADASNIAAWLRHNSHDPHRAAAILNSS